MDGWSFGAIALAVGVGICAAGGLLGAWTASRRVRELRAQDDLWTDTGRG